MAGRMGKKESAESFAGFDIDGVFERQKITLPVFKHGKKTVQMNGVFHHRIVDEREADFFAERNMDRRGFGKLLAVKSPDEAIHISGEMKLKRAPGRGHVVMRTERAQIRVSQDPPGHFRRARYLLAQACFAASLQC